MALYVLRRSVSANLVTSLSPLPDACASRLRACQGPVRAFSLLAASPTAALHPSPQGVSVAGAFILGFPLSAVISAQYGLRAPMYAAAAVGLLNCLIITFITPESLPPAQRSGQCLAVSSSVRVHRARAALSSKHHC